MDHFAQTLSAYQQRVSRALDRSLPAAPRSPPGLHEALRYATLDGGKRIRAALVYATGQALGCPLELLDRPACAVEMIHAYSLVHDDLPAMDDDDLRRGKPTCHRQYDEATAVLVGDALQSLAFQLLSESPGDADPRRRLEGVNTLARAAARMAAGQAIDLAAAGEPLSLPELENMHICKTGALIRAAVRLAVLAAEPVDRNIEQALDRFSKYLGLAFQIHDDILDEEGDTQTLGKAAGADRARAKATYPALLGLAEAKHEARVMHDKAVASIAVLGDNGEVLRAIAGYVVARSH